MKLSTEIAKGCPSAHSKKLQCSVSLLRVNAVEVVVNRRSRRVKASGLDAPSLKALDTYPKQSSIIVVMSAVVGLSGAMKVMNALRSGRSQPGTHVGDHRPSVQRSTLRIRIPDMPALTDRVSCCAPAALFIEAGNGRTENESYIFEANRNIRAANGRFMPRIGSGIGGSYR